MLRKRLFCFFKILKHQKGFTLTEVVVTLSVLGVMTAISIPSYISWLPRHRLQTSVRQLYDDINLAKIRAVKDNAIAVVIFDFANNDYDIFLDTVVQNWALDGGEPVIRRDASFESGVTMAGSTFPFNTTGFNNRGMLPTGAAPGGQVTLTNATGIIMGVSVNTAGNISVF
jgi:prepilin-type N-terminal cleavage/methylation domain-containing protein